MRGLCENVLAAVGWTPLVRLKRVAEGLPCPVYGKLEMCNPGGSVKDRIGWAMIEDAEQRGLIHPGRTTIIEATAGNTGVGLALAAAVKGYRCIFVLPDKMSREKVDLLRAYGAETVIVPTNVPPDSPESYAGVARRLAQEIPDAWRPDQFTNLANPEIHYRTTGPEIWEQTEGPRHLLRSRRRNRGDHFRCRPLSKRKAARYPHRGGRSGRLRPVWRYASPVEGRRHW